MLVTNTLRKSPFVSLLGGWLAIAALACVACGGGAEDAVHPATDAAVDMTHAPRTDGAVDAGSQDAVFAETSADSPFQEDAPAVLDAGCQRDAGPSDRARKVVVSHPFADGGAKSSRYEVLDLATDGELSRPGATFAMGRATDKPIVFTRDGRFGFVVQEDGSIGSFEISETGVVSVRYAAFTGDFYAYALALDPTETRLFVLDSQTRDNGGGVYEIAVHCDGTLDNRGLFLAGNTAFGLAFTPGDTSHAVISAGAITGATTRGDTHLVDMSIPRWKLGGAAFADGEAIVSSLALSPDGKYALVSDNGLFRGSRVGVVSLSNMSSVDVLTTEFPVQLVFSPYGNSVLVLNGDATDHLTRITYDPFDAAAPFRVAGRLAYKFPRPALPASAAMIVRGSLAGRVFVAENLAVRQVEFRPDGDIVDHAQLSLGRGAANIVGTIGVQP